MRRRETEEWRVRGVCCKWARWPVRGRKRVKHGTVVTDDYRLSFDSGSRDKGSSARPLSPYPLCFPLEIALTSPAIAAGQGCVTPPRPSPCGRACGSPAPIRPLPRPADPSSSPGGVSLLLPWRRGSPDGVDGSPLVCSCTARAGARH